jgi:hypothetical protein
MLRMFLVVAAIVPLAAAPAAAQDLHSHDASLGSVRFTNSCAAAVQEDLTHAVVLLHSFEFGPSRDAFTKVLAADQSCAIALWGAALTQWGNPFATGIKPAPIVQAGKAAIDRAKSIGAKTDRERAFIDAAGKLFDPADADQRLRIAAYRDAMAAVAAKFPDDPEASTFYALALAFAASPTDKTYADQLKAGAILEKLWTQQPQHPGLPHYIIHAYDVPALASRAVDAARRYGKIAPDAPHALHMPSHTFTRLGYWKESIDTNLLSAAAARRTNTIGEELHASDYLEYAYLQLGEYDDAKRVVDSLAEIISRIQPATAGAAPPAAGPFARAAIPARYALERSAWAEAAALEVHPSATLYADAITWFARALGAARSKDPSLVVTAEKAIDELQSLADRLSAANEPYWTEQVAIQRLGASAWLALAKGQPDRAVTLMREAADREDRTEKSAVTPGPLAPAHEMLGEMLLELNRAKDAVREFDTTMAKEPNRLRARQGADAAKARATRSGVPGRSAARTISVHSVVLDR